LTYAVSEAKNRFSEVVRQAESGHRVVITKRGTPIVEIIRTTGDVKSKRTFGVLGNKRIVIDPNWARPQADIDAWLAGDV